MRRVFLWLFMSLASGLAHAPALAAQQAQPPKAKKEKRVWTNEGLEDLRGQSRVSVVGQSSAANTNPASPKTGPSARAAREADKFNDPEWYRAQLKPLRAQLENIELEMRKLRRFQANDTSPEGGLVMGGRYSMTSPDKQIEDLEKRRGEVQNRIEELEDQARRNGIPPGAIR